MKKIILSLLLLPTFVLADNLNSLTIGYGQLDGALTDLAGSDNIDGISVGFTSGSNKAIFDIEHWQATGDDDGWQTWANVAFAFDDFSTGSMYAGLAGTDGDILDDEFGLVLGYQKRSDQGTDYNFSATSYDGYVVYGIDVIAQNGLSLSINDYANAMTVMQIGYSFSY